jgi:hypothetical protein
MKACGIIVMCALGLGCGRPAPAESTISASKPAASEPKDPPSAPAASLVAKAEQALKESMRLDYRRPLILDPVDRTAIRASYLEACKTGNPRACWMVLNVANRIGERLPYEGEAKTLVRANCIAGDRMSCRALTEASRDPGEDPNHSAAWLACNMDTTTCDFEALHRGCLAGFPANCDLWLDKQPDAPDRAELIALEVRLARDGCRKGLLSECGMLRDRLEAKPGTPIPDRVLAAEQLCAIGLDCNKLGALYQSTDAVKARDAYERACQLTDYVDEPSLACKDAWRAYTDPKSGITEPVPGRAKQLRDWACTQHHDCW